MKYQDLVSSPHKVTLLKTSLRQPGAPLSSALRMLHHILAQITGMLPDEGFGPSRLGVTATPQSLNTLGQWLCFRNNKVWGLWPEPHTHFTHIHFPQTPGCYWGRGLHHRTRLPFLHSKSTAGPSMLSPANSLYLAPPQSCREVLKMLSRQRK